jgi:hypothetical protein
MKWIANDGKLFSCRHKAKAYEDKLALKEKTIKIKPVKPIKQPKIKVVNPLKDRYYVYLLRSQDRNFEFDFTREEFYALISLPCYYCGSKSTGLDRLDSKKGYTWANIEPACYLCNVMKFTMTYSDFIDRVHKIASIHQKH